MGRSKGLSRNALRAPSSLPLPRPDSLSFPILGHFAVEVTSVTYLSQIIIQFAIIVAAIAASLASGPSPKDQMDESPLAD